MNNEEIIQKTIEFVKKTLSHSESGHDWWHMYRVWNLAKHIAKEESVDLFIVELGSLLHDIADSKFHNGDESVAPKMARNFLSSIDVEEDVIKHVENIILNISFKGGNYEQKFKSPELDVIQDADRLDGIGAIGLARTFNYGGSKNRLMYHPEIKPKMNMSKEEYVKEAVNCESTSINHFYEKLLLLKDRMNTETGRKMAEHRHKFMELFLDEFHREWNGET